MSADPTLFERAWIDLLRIEGVWSDHPSDAGGKTKWGVTEATARAAGWHGKMADLPLTVAASIAKSRYWDVMHLDDVAAIAGEAIACELLEEGYNCGPMVAAQWLQRALNAFNRRGKDYAEIRVDGKVGNRTMEALAALVARRGEDGKTVLLRALQSQQGSYYLHLGEIRQANEDFMFGWFRLRVR